MLVRPGFRESAYASPSPSASLRLVSILEAGVPQEWAPERTARYEQDLGAPYVRLDHFFILTERDAPEAALLIELGLVEGTSNDHPGQGTANRRFFFSNTALELLYIRDAKEAEEGPGQALRIPDRASSPLASPFGLIMRNDGDSGQPAFPGWRYQPEYFDPGVSFLVGDNSDRLEEPLCICMPESPPAAPTQATSESPFTEITELRLQVPVEEPSEVLVAVGRTEMVQIETGRPHLLEIVFDNGNTGNQQDLRPGLPLKICW